MKKSAAWSSGILFIAIAFTTYSCKHNIPQAVTGDVCFETEVLPIFQSSCAKSGCHNANSAAEGYVLDSYQNIMNDGIVPYDADKSEIIEVILETDPDKIMPPPGSPALTTEQINLLLAWVNQGAPNTVGCSASVCDTLNFQYALHVKPII